MLSLPRPLLARVLVLAANVEAGMALLSLSTVCKEFFTALRRDHAARAAVRDYFEFMRQRSIELSRLWRELGGTVERQTQSDYEGWTEVTLKQQWLAHVLKRDYPFLRFAGTQLTEFEGQMKKCRLCSFDWDTIHKQKLKDVSLFGDGLIQTYVVQKSSVPNSKTLDRFFLSLLMYHSSDMRWVFRCPTAPSTDAEDENDNYVRYDFDTGTFPVLWSFDDWEHLLESFCGNNITPKMVSLPECRKLEAYCYKDGNFSLAVQDLPGSYVVLMFFTS